MKVIFYSLVISLGLFSCSDNSAAPETVPESAVPEIPEVEDPQPADRTEVIPEQTKDSHKAAPNESIEDKILTDIIGMAEIRKLDETIQKRTQGKHKLKSYVSARPSDDAEYYTITVAEDNGGAMATLHTFHVYPDNTVAYDVVEDREISLKEWRKSLK